MTPDDARPSDRDQRRARLAASLRENLKRRKAQARQRATAPVEEDASRPGTAPACAGDASTNRA